jgi:hypothetical protein
MDVAASQICGLLLSRVRKQLCSEELRYQRKAANGACKALALALAGRSKPRRNFRPV